MELKIYTGYETLSTNVDEDEGSLFKAIGKVLPSLKDKIPTTLAASCPYGKIEFEVGKRGTYTQNGITYPSMYVKTKLNALYPLPSPKKPYKDAYLTCINPESNNYKFYWLKPKYDGIHATYGRIGSKRGEAFGEKDLQTPYPSYLYWIRYYEKLSKGYEDQTDIYLNSPKIEAKDVKSEKQDKAPANPVSTALYEKLMAYARHVVQKTLVSENVTKKQVRMAKKYLVEAGRRKTVKAFNKWLMKVLVLSPRKERYINTLHATSPSSYTDIIEREENLIAAMEAVATGNVSSKLSESQSFENHGIEVYEATDKQKEKILNKLSDTLKGRVRNVYRVIPKEQKKRFDSYLEKEHIKTVKELWHGSRNENWASIILNSLQLNPNAVITGKMFGQGIYFAPSSMKSFNYTSCRGTSWANGKDDTGFMGIYAVAYGESHDVSMACRYSKTDLKRIGKNCVHAHAGTQLRNDEIVFYDEDAVCLNYIVEFSA